MDRSEFNKIRSVIKEPNREAVEHNLVLLYRLMNWPEFDYIVYCQSPTHFCARADLYEDYYWHRYKHIKRRRTTLQERFGRMETEDIWLSFLPTLISRASHNILARYSKIRTPELTSIWKNLAKESLEISPKPKVPIVLEKPIEIHVDDRNRPHNENGPAVLWRDGTKGYFFQGLSATKRFVEGEPTISYINSQWNAERKRVLIERIGYKKYLDACNAELIHETELGKLWHIPGSWRDSRKLEDTVVVEVLNSTPEPDGTRNRYFLRVPPHISRVKTAVAWTFKKNNSGYNPVAES